MSESNKVEKFVEGITSTVQGIKNKAVMLTALAAGLGGSWYFSHDSHKPVAQAEQPKVEATQPATPQLPTGSLPVASPMASPLAAPVGQTVSFVVQGGHKTQGGLILLNSEKDYRSPSNQVIVLKGPDFASASPQTYIGRQVTAIGSVEQYRGKPQLVVTSASAIH